MKPFPISADTPPAVAGEWLSEHGWSLADVLEWLVGKSCEVQKFLPGCRVCYADPPAEYARDVLVAFIENGGATHPKQVEFAQRLKTSWYKMREHRGLHALEVNERGDALTGPDNELNMGLKRRILQLFSGPVEDEKCRQCDGRKILTDPYDYDKTESGDRCDLCHGSGVIPGGGVRIAQMRIVESVGLNNRYGHATVTPEQLLPLAVETVYALRPAAARV